MRQLHVKLKGQEYLLQYDVSGTRIDSLTVWLGDLIITDTEIEALAMGAASDDFASRMDREYDELRDRELDTDYSDDEMSTFECYRTLK